MTDQLLDELRNYLEVIDLQIASITVVNNPQHDYDYALADQILQLRELKARVIADASNPTPTPIPTPTLIPPTSRKRPADVSNDAREDSPAENFHHTRSKRVRLAEAVECSTCLESVRTGDTTTLKCCNTVYCKSCLCEWFRTALFTHQLPKCCEEGIEPKHYPGKITRPLITQYKNVVKELEAERKLWCANMNCQAFIKINVDTSGFVQCTKCRRKTCASCAGSTSVHKGRRGMCPNHLKDEILESAMVKNKWKRCPRCHVVVEKSQGCNSIRCTCGVMFCFGCGTSKSDEGNRCKCSNPGMRFDELAEDPVSENEAAS